MDQRIDEATKRWAEERAKLEAEIKSWRDKTADLYEKILAAETVKTRHALKIMELCETLRMARVAVTIVARQDQANNHWTWLKARIDEALDASDQRKHDT